MSELTSKEQEYHTKYREEHREERRFYGRNRYYARKAAGLCTHCGEHNDGPYVKCATCREKHEMYKQQYHATEAGRRKDAEYAAKRRKRRDYKDWRSRYMRERYKNDIQFRLARLISGRLNKMLRGIYTSQSLSEYLGCSFEELKQYLETRFESGMSWENHGEWHIDHVIPLASVDLTNPKELARVCHYSNLQPLWADENIRKGANI